ncbi:MAG: hypothetical protein ACLPX5_02835 [Dissulfurispiraceae bacterium]
MYKEHKVFDTPPDNQTIWRYMSFAKFAWLIANKALYFSRLDQHRDKWEGTLPTNRDFETVRYTRYNRFINCWHMNEGESDAMWKLYGGSFGETVAIKTSIGHLKQSLRQSSLDVLIGRVIYNVEQGNTIENQNNPLYFPVLRKRKPFEHEQEVRLCVCSEQNPNPPDFTPLKEELARLGMHFNGLDILKRYDGQNGRGIPICVNLSQLIEEVFLCPDEKDYLEDSVKYILMSGKLSDRRVRRSRMC